MVKLEITKVFYPGNRQEWREWLRIHHRLEPEIWLRTFKKASGKPSISYDDMVEECLCFGWIDSIIKSYDAESKVQRITPRKKKSFLSELNRHRVWKLKRSGLMTPAGIEVIKDQIASPDDPYEFPDWIREQLEEDPVVWANFQGFSGFYQRLKIAWIRDVRAGRKGEAQRRLNYLIKMTRQGKRYGASPMDDELVDI